ncbi:hypothetical protein, partial [Bacillus subtilis]|uniref:hypothetical protein n=1 Tax=Bacillus subtilis TaxID=1423 RepID=UPI001BDBAC1D
RKMSWDEWFCCGWGNSGVGVKDKERFIEEFLLSEWGEGKEKRCWKRGWIGNEFGVLNLELIELWERV